MLFDDTTSSGKCFALFLYCVWSAYTVVSAASVSQDQADSWSNRFRNWSYYPTYVNKPSKFTDCAQVWQAESDTDLYRMSFLVYDGIGYETHLATSTDLVNWSQQGVIYSPREKSPPLSWNATPGEFDYGGAAFIGPLVQDYNISGNRRLLQMNGKYWVTYFGQPIRNECEPPPVTCEVP
jgi:hypothetical protein